MGYFLAIISIACSVYTISAESTSRNLQKYQLENTTWFRKQLSTYPVRHLEYDLHVEFPANACCPIIVIVGEFIDPAVWARGCYDNVRDNIRLATNWLKHTFFNLATWKEENSNLQCAFNSTTETIRCDVLGIAQRYHIPFQRSINIGYPCNEVRSMSQFHIWIELYNEKNETACESMIDDNFHEDAVKCNQFYGYTSFPNAFGDWTQQDAARAMDVVNQYFSKNEKPCHKYLTQFACMLFFPSCPHRINEMTKVPFETDYFIQSCKELGNEVIEACLNEIGLIIVFVPATTYFPSVNGSISCFYERVKCGAPPQIKNGHAAVVHHSTKWYAKDTTHYICDEKYERSSTKNLSMCSYSGFWEDVPTCESINHNNDGRILSTGTNKNGYNSNMTIVIVIILAATILCCFIGYIVYSKSIKTSKQQSYHKARNRPYDAFISYEAGGEDEQFMRNEICKRFDTDYGGRYKLFIHQRDFKPGTLILANIQDAVRDTNCALVLLSQLYIR